jgi:hypothetical protein
MTVVCVLGSGRSGTSAVADLVQALGAYLGPEDRLQLATAWNPEGCWEHLDLVQINSEVLARFEKGPVVFPAPPPTFPSGWHKAPELEGLKVKAREVMARDFSGHPLWAWKVPASCLAIPFWREVMDDMRYVICVRNPVDVTASLEKQWQIPFLQGIDMWLERNLSCVLHTAGHPRFFFSFDDYFQDPEGQIARLARFLDRPVPQKESTDANDRQVFSTVKGELRTFTSSMDLVMNDDRLTDGDKYFYRGLLAACRAPEGTETVDLDALLDAYRGATRGRYRKLHEYFTAYATQAEAELKQAREARAYAPA